MDLHAWITQQVDRAETLAKAATPGPWEGVVDHHQRGEVNASVWSDKLGYYITEQVVSERYEADAHFIGANGPDIALRRCEADRRVLARHTLATEWPWAHDAPCHGCGTEGDCDDPVTDNLNDCPELLDLAHGRGITPEILAGLDQPQTPERKPSTGPRLGLGDILATPPITTSDVPAALRGTNWKP